MYLALSEKKRFNASYMARENGSKQGKTCVCCQAQENL